ncbi:hypothetical protein INS49_015151 [Diaporthe citri]|uniref:uncharacterized protein n=1 Tax=Diaporthe citri TaxID=83186 RepID=UPI001C81BA83|nr:uncharacterized protein INS49_015151 [Diaporthe citri]KAG6357273.1 hypothetical protein INS49_015151 [Diaporthe citri]
MSTSNSSTGSKARKPSTPTSTIYTFDFCDNTELRGTKKVVVQGQMRGLSPFQRAKLLSSESRVCIAYRDGNELLVLKENINSDILYHYCPNLRTFYACCKETGPTIVLPNTDQFSLVGAFGVDWVIESFVHEVSQGARSFYSDFVPSHSNPKQLFHAAAAFRAFDLPRFAEDLVARDNGAIVRSLKHTARNIKSPKAVGKWIRSLKKDPLICQADQALLVEAYKVLARRIEGYNGKKVENTE